MKRFSTLKIVLFSALIACVETALAADKIGLSLPLAGRYEAISSRMETGAKRAVEHLNTIGRDIELLIVDDKCDPKTADEIANKLIEDEIRLVIGPLCFQYASALTSALKLKSPPDTKIPVITFNTRNRLLQRLREVDELALYAVSNRHDAEAQAVVDLILPRFEGKAFAILDDGSVYGRALADDIRLLGEEIGLQAVVSTNFRPLQNTQLSLLRRLQSSGVEAIFVAGDAQDVATIAQDMKTLGLDWEIATAERGALLPYTVTTPEILDDLLMIQESRLKLSNTNAALQEEEKNDPNILIGYSLVELAAQFISKDDKTLVGGIYETSVGPWVFDNLGRASPAPFELLQWRDGGFEPLSPQ